MAVNTLQIANRLKAAEREGRSAEELALLFGEIEEERFARLVTRDQLALELEKIRAEIEKLRTELHGRIGRVEGEVASLRTEIERQRLQLMHDLTVRVGGMLAAGIAVLGTLIAIL